MLGTQSTNGSNMIFFPNLPYDPIRDFQPLTLIGTACMALVTAPNVPANTPKELVEWAKKQDGGVSYASAAPGSSQHVAAELMVRRAGMKATHVPYRGSSAAMPDLMSGRVAFMFDNLPSALPAGARRQGQGAGPDLRQALALGARPADHGGGGLPRLRHRRLVRHLRAGQDAASRSSTSCRPTSTRSLKEPESMEKWKTLGFDPIGTTPEAFAERQKADLAYWKKMIDYTGIKVE